MSETTPHATHPPVRTSVAAMISANVAAIAIWAVASMSAAELTVSVGSGQTKNIRVVNVVVAALVGSLAGWGLLAVLRQFTARARAVWAVMAVIAALLFLTGSLTATASASTKVSFVAMHLAIAGVLIALLRRTGE